MNETLYDLIRISIGTQEKVSSLPSQSDWWEIYEFAKKQSIVGILFCGLQILKESTSRDIFIDETLYLRWMGYAAQIQNRNEQLNKQCIELQHNLLNDGLRSSILKGQGVAQLYNKRLRNFRQSGDIDIWIEGKCSQVLDYVNSRTPNREFDMKHAHFFCFKDTVVEAHWTPALTKNPLLNIKLATYFKSEQNRQFEHRVRLVEDLDAWAPTVDFQLIHSLLHLYIHFLYEGVGMRQIMDLYFTQKACDSFARATVLNKMKSFGMTSFVKATQYVIREVFGVDENNLLCEADEKGGNELLKEIMLGGNFGQYNKDNNVRNESFFKRMFRRYKRTVRLIRFNPLGIIFTPIGKLKYLIWKQIIIAKYNL